MFEFLMSIGFLWAGLCHWQPRGADGGAAPEKGREEHGKRKKKIRGKRPERKAVRAEIVAA
jgi:hypothetical protein